MKTFLRQVENEGGMVLLVVLLVVALLVTILVEFAFSTLVDLRLAETYRDTTRAYYLAKGGIRVGQTMLQEDGNNYDAKDELWAQGVESYPVADGTVSIHIEDDGGKINLNRLLTPEGNPETVIKGRFIALLNILGVIDPEGLTDTVIDWIDADETPQGNGAESSYYRSLPDPYNCKNGPFDSLEELSLLKGFTPEVIRELRPHVTVYGDVMFDKRLMVNVNTASPEVLQSLAEGLDGNTAEMIVAARRDRPFTTKNQLKELIGIDIFSQISLYTQFTSSYYVIESTAFVNDGRRTIRVNVKKNGGIEYKRVL